MEGGGFIPSYKATEVESRIEDTSDRKMQGREKSVTEYNFIWLEE